MNIKFIFKYTFHNKQMHSPRLPRLYKYRDSYVLFLPTVHAFGIVIPYTHSFGTDTHT